jgi:hypothetical protein
MDESSEVPEKLTYSFVRRGNHKHFHRGGAGKLHGYRLKSSYGKVRREFVRLCPGSGTPSTGGEFQNYQSFRTHNFDVLLRLSGAEEKVKTTLMTEWSAVAAWDPEARYKPIGSTTRQAAELMIISARTLLKAL